MNTAPLERPTKATILRSYASTIEADPDAVFAALAPIVEATAGEGFFVTDPGTRRAIAQGGWWYRAEYRVLVDDAGSRIEHELVNVAERFHWAGPIAGRAAVADSANAFQRVLSQVVDALEAPTD